MGPSADFGEVDFILRVSGFLWELLIVGDQSFCPLIGDLDPRIVWRCFAFASFAPIPLTSYKNAAFLIHGSIVCDLLRPPYWTHSYFFGHVVQREGGMLSALRLAQAYA